MECMLCCGTEAARCGLEVKGVQTGAVRAGPALLATCQMQPCRRVRVVAFAARRGFVPSVLAVAVVAALAAAPALRAAAVPTRAAASLAALVFRQLVCHRLRDGAMQARALRYRYAGGPNSPPEEATDAWIHRSTEPCVAPIRAFAR